MGFELDNLCPWHDAVVVVASAASSPDCCGWLLRVSFEQPSRTETWRSGKLNTGICASQPSQRECEQCRVVMRADFAPHTAESRFRIYDTSEAALRIKRNVTSGTAGGRTSASILQENALVLPACCNNYVLGVDMFVRP